MDKDSGSLAKERHLCYNRIAVPENGTYDVFSVHRDHINMEETG